MTARRSTTETEIPLSLIPTAIARQIKLHGGVVHRISVMRPCRHYYNITVRKKSLNREFKIRNERALLFEDARFEDRISNGDSGGVI